MNNTDQFDKDATGRSRAALDQGFKAYRSALKADYRLIKERALIEPCKKEIGYHSHMPKPCDEEPDKK